MTKKITLKLDSDDLNRIVNALFVAGDCYDIYTKIDKARDFVTDKNPSENVSLKSTLVVSK